MARYFSKDEPGNKAGVGKDWKIRPTPVYENSNIRFELSYPRKVTVRDTDGDIVVQDCEPSESVSRSTLRIKLHELDGDPKNISPVFLAMLLEEALTNTSLVESIRGMAKRVLAARKQNVYKAGRSHDDSDVIAEFDDEFGS